MRHSSWITLVILYIMMTKCHVHVSQTCHNLLQRKNCCCQFYQNIWRRNWSKTSIVWWVVNFGKYTWAGMRMLGMYNKIRKRKLDHCKNFKGNYLQFQMKHVLCFWKLDTTFCCMSRPNSHLWITWHKRRKQLLAFMDRWFLYTVQNTIEAIQLRHFCLAYIGVAYKANLTVYQSRSNQIIFPSMLPDIAWSRTHNVYSSFILITY